MFAICTWLFQEVKFDYNSIKMSPALSICTLYIHGQATILLNTNIKKNIYLPATNTWTLKYTLGDKLQQHVAATRRSEKSLRVCWRILWKSLSPQHNFVAATSRKKSNQTEFVRLVAATRLCCRDKDFHKNSPVHTKRFVAATCRRNVLLQLVDGPVHRVICCRDLLLQLVA